MDYNGINRLYMMYDLAQKNPYNKDFANSYMEAYMNYMNPVQPQEDPLMALLGGGQQPGMQYGAMGPNIQAGGQMGSQQTAGADGIAGNADDLVIEVPDDNAQMQPQDFAQKAIQGVTAPWSMIPKEIPEAGGNLFSSVLNSLPITQAVQLGSGIAGNLASGRDLGESINYGAKDYMKWMQDNTIMGGGIKSALGEDRARQLYQQSPANQQYGGYNDYLNQGYSNPNRISF